MKYGMARAIAKNLQTKLAKNKIGDILYDSRKDGKTGGIKGLWKRMCR